MVLIKNLLGILQVEVIDRHLAPRKVEHELYVIILYAVVRRRRIISLKLCYLLVKDRLHSCRPEFLLRACAQLRKLLHLIHTQFLLDGLELTVEIVFPLLLVDLGLHLLMYLLLDLLQLDLCVKDRQKLHCTRPEVRILQEFYPIHIIIHLNCSCDEIDKEFKAIYAFQGPGRLARCK